MSKMCSKCKKAESRNGSGYCQACHERQKEWVKNNKDKISKYVLKPRTPEQKAKYLEKRNSDDKYKLYQKNKQKTNRKTSPSKNEEQKQRNFFNMTLRNIINGTVTEKVREKLELRVGCSVLDLVAHLEEHYLMEYCEYIHWKNWSRKVEKHLRIEVDHLTEVYNFDLTTVEGVKNCWHFTNLRMVKQIDNRPGRPSNKKRGN